MNPLVSICIPAWERPELLTITLESCFAQTYQPIEVVVADDSRSGAIRRLAQRYSHLPNFRYVWNEERLGQAGNVNRVFELAQGDRVVLMHDDDTLLPDAVEAMHRAWIDDPSTLLCYGKCRVVTHDGAGVPGAEARYAHFADELRARYRDGGPSNLWYVLDGHFPTNGFLVRRDAACATGYRDAPEIGDNCDVDFQLRIARQPGAFRFVDRFVSTYRITDVSVSTESKAGERIFFLLEKLDVPAELEPVRQRLLRERLVSAIRSELLFGRYDVADRLMAQYAHARRPTPACLLNRVMRRVPHPLLVKAMALKHTVRRQLRRGGWFYRLRAWKRRSFRLRRGAATEGQR